jgi:hypothetical protein
MQAAHHHFSDEVVETCDGIGYRLAHGRTFTSLSSAAKAVIVPL